MDESIINSKVLDKLKKLGKESIIEFLGIKDSWSGAFTTKLLFRNKIYSECGEIIYNTFFHNKNGWLCESEKRLLNSETHRSSEKEAIDKINNKIRDLGKPIKFLGFENNKWEGYNKSIISLLNIEFNEVGNIKYSEFIKRGWLCKSELTMIKRNSGRYIKESDAINNITSKLSNLEDNINLVFIKFDGEWKGSTNSKIILQNLDDGKECSILYSQFMRKTWKSGQFMKGETLRNNFLMREEIGKRIIFDHLELLNKILKPHIFKFIGWDNWLGANNKTKLIIDQDGSSHKISYVSFLRKFSPFNINIKEEKCGEILTNLRLVFIRQYKIKNPYKSLNRDNFIVDFYIPEINTIIEYDGEQHYQSIDHFGGYEKFVERVYRDRCLEDYCRDNNIKLLRIPYLDNDRLEEVIRAFIIEGEDITTHIQPKLLPALIYD